MILLVFSDDDDVIDADEADDAEIKQLSFSLAKYVIRWWT